MTFVSSLLLSFVLFTLFTTAIVNASIVPPPPAPSSSDDPPLCAPNKTTTPPLLVAPRAYLNGACAIDMDVTAPCTKVSWHVDQVSTSDCLVRLQPASQCYSLQIEADYDVQLSYFAGTGSIVIAFNLNGTQRQSLSDSIFVNGPHADLTATFQFGTVRPTSFDSLFKITAVPCGLLPSGVPMQPQIAMTTDTPSTTTASTIASSAPATCTLILIEPPTVSQAVRCQTVLQRHTVLPCFEGTWRSPQWFNSTCMFSYYATLGLCLRMDLFTRFDQSTPGLFIENGYLTAAVAENAPMTHRSIEVLSSSITFNLQSRSSPTNAEVPFNVAFTEIPCANVRTTTADQFTTAAPNPWTWDTDTDSTDTATDTVDPVDTTTLTSWWVVTTNPYPSRRTGRTKTQPLTDRPDGPDVSAPSATDAEDHGDGAWMWITAASVTVVGVLILIGVVVWVVVRRRRNAASSLLFVRPPPGAPPQRFVIV
jgi:hypothetical protein